MTEMNEEQRRFMRCMSKHLVVLSFVVQRFKEGKPTKLDGFHLSGWIINLHDHIFWATASHSLKLIDKEIEKGNMEIDSVRFVDCFGAEAKDDTSIPFHYEPGCGIFREGDEPGYDAALIPVDYLTMRGFLYNKVKAVGRANWIHQTGMQFDHYKMLGIPAHLTQFSVSKRGEISTGIRPVMIAIDAVDRATIKNPPPEDWFVGRIHEDVEIESIEGMSGGPIYGFRKTDENWFYHVVALQSRWREEERIIFGSPVKLFAEAMHQAFGDALQGLTDSGDVPESE